eukprot:gene20261-29720_t
MSSLAPPTSPRPGLAGNGAGSTATFMPGDDVLNPGLAGSAKGGSSMTLGGELWHQALQYMQVFSAVPAGTDISK